jgi:four helix bundle protein
MAVNYFEDLEIWKEARRLTGRIYDITHNHAFSKDYGLCDQIRRASVSIMSNIAEGYERGGNQELSQFLSIAKGSCGEVRAQLYIALDQKYIDTEESTRLIDDFRKLSIMIHNFMKYLRTTPYKGVKYKQPKQKSMKEEIEKLLEEVHAQRKV